MTSNQMLNIKFSLIEAPFLPEQNEVVEQSTIHWSTRATVDGRHLVECIVQESDIQTLLDAFSVPDNDLKPLVLGGWKQDGLPVNCQYTQNEEGEQEIAFILDENKEPMIDPFPFLRAEYMAFMPDIVGYEEGEEVSREPATEPSELLKFGGWMPVVWDVKG